MSRRVLNQRTVLKIEPTTRQDDMAAFEQLPIGLRRLVREHAVSLNAGSVLAFFRSIHAQGATPHEAEVYTERKLRAVEAGEIAAFAASHRQRFGSPLPHAAAAVSIQRYEAPRPRRARRFHHSNHREAA